MAPLTHNRGPEILVSRLQLARIGIVPTLVLTLIIAPEPAARAWDDFGHMEVAAVAFKNLKPRARRRVAQLLKLNPSYANWIVGAAPGDEDRMAFMRAATWADAIKSDPSYQADDQSAATASRNIGYADHLRHTYWHYVNRPFSPDGTPLLPPATPNAEIVIPILRAALSSASTPDDVKSYDLVWLLHLVGDIHQPLHCVGRFDADDPKGDRGGLNVKITGNAQPPICDDPRYCPYGPPPDLHLFLDDIAGASYAVAPVEAAAAKLPAADPEKVAISDVAVWIQEGFDLAQSAVYVPPIGVGDGPFTITPQYQAAAVKLGRARIALAGRRLANLINQTLEP
jgi:hypothetical protein